MLSKKILEKDFFACASFYLSCRLAIINPAECQYIHSTKVECLEQGLLGLVDNQLEMEMLVAEMRRA